MVIFSLVITLFPVNSIIHRNKFIFLCPEQVYKTDAIYQSMLISDVLLFSKFVTLEYCLFRRVSSHNRYPVLTSTKLLTWFHRSIGVKFELDSHLETES